MIKQAPKGDDFYSANRVINSLENVLSDFSEILPSLVEKWSDDERTYFSTEIERVLDEYKKEYQDAARKN